MGPPWGATKGLIAPEQKGIKLILGFSKLFPVPFPSEGLSGAPVFNLSLQNLPLERAGG